MNEANLANENGSKTYEVTLREFTGKKYALRIKANPNDTIKSFIDELMRVWCLTYSKKGNEGYGIKLFYCGYTINRSIEYRKKCSEFFW